MCRYLCAKNPAPGCPADNREPEPVVVPAEGEPLAGVDFGLAGAAVEPAAVLDLFDEEGWREYVERAMREVPGTPPSPFGRWPGGIPFA